MTNTDYFRELLNASLAILASDAEAQISRLQKLAKPLGPGAEVVDELALDFNEAVTYARQLRDGGHISQAVYDALAVIDKKLNQMSGHENTDLWCFEGRVTEASGETCVASPDRLCHFTAPKTDPP